MRALEPKYLLGRDEKEIRELMAGMSYHFYGDSRIQNMVTVPQTEYTLLFEPPIDHPANVAAIAFKEGISVSLTLVGGNMDSISKWLEEHAKQVESPKLSSVPGLPIDMKRILYHDKDFWYNVRLTPDSKYGITITSKAQFP